MPTPRILIVEDEGIIARNIERHLERLGYGITGICGDADSAQAMLSQERPDLVLMDVQLEGDLDGVGLADIIRRDLDIPVIYLTGYLDDATLERAKITQPFGYIAKPFTRRELQVTIEIALYKYRMERTLSDRELQIQELLDTMQQGFCLLDGEHRIISANRKLAELMGLASDALQGRDLFTLIHPEDHETLRSALSSQDAQGERPRRIRILSSAHGVVPLILIAKVLGSVQVPRGSFISLTEIPRED